MRCSLIKTVLNLKSPSPTEAFYLERSAEIFRFERHCCKVLAYNGMSLKFRGVEWSVSPLLSRTSNHKRQISLQQGVKF